MPENSRSYDILVAGAGFAGSLTTLILHELGFRVCLAEKGQHPRFAIGESSTPVADLILRRLSSQYHLPWLHAFSRYGSWQQEHPEIVCGIKRGFSYFKQHPGKAFSTDADHRNELLVAASTSDLRSDTNWLRSDFDAFLVKQVKEAGIPYSDLTEILSAERKTQWEFRAVRSGKAVTFHASFFIDASGSGNLLNRMLGVRSGSEDFQTDSFAVFSHFLDVPAWMEILQKAGIPTRDFPYNPDHSALHHVLDEGWLWVLRFNDRRSSMGFVLDRGKYAFPEWPAEQVWQELLKKYPALNAFMKDLSFASQPGSLIRSGRLQRRTMQCAGPGWVALPHTAGFVDPLFSTGIAQSLNGIEKIVRILHEDRDHPERLDRDLKEYEQAVFGELKLIDLLVAGCYRTMAHFDLFNSWSMLYFAATIASEQSLMQNKTPGYLLKADDPLIRKNVQKSYAELLEITGTHPPRPEDIRQFTQRIEKRIRPLNTAGLLDPSFRNMYPHTAAEL